MMERIRRMLRLWNWLPAFRVVAETEHIHRAAELLHVTPSTLSRAIRLVEEDVGRQLFDRIGRNIVLNPSGQEFLAALRDAMQKLDDGLTQVTTRKMSGLVRIGCSSCVALTFVLPAFELLEQTHPQLAPDFRLQDLHLASVQLLRGELDVAFLFHPQSHPRLAVEIIGEVTRGIYCGERHPLRRMRAPTLEAVLEHSFIASQPRDGEDLTDEWPVELQRKVSVYLPEIQLAVELCARGQLLAVLPDRLASASDKLRRLPLEIIPSARLLAVRRDTPVALARVEALIGAMRSQFSNTPC